MAVSVLKELRIKEGQTVKRDEIIAVMGNYPAAEVGLKIAENNLLKTERMRETILKGTRVVDIQLQEDALKSAIESDRLSTMLRPRSGKPPEEKELEVWLAEQSLKNQRASLELSKRRLAIDLEQNAVDIIRLKAALDQALRVRRGGPRPLADRRRRDPDQFAPGRDGVGPRASPRSST